ncbi:hypothetical protein AgCh_025432 [Apium graveolens]
MANNSNNFSMRSVLEKDKLIGTNFLDWQRNLRIVLKQERKLYIIDIPRPTPGANVVIEVETIGSRSITGISPMPTIRIMVLLDLSEIVDERNVKVHLMTSKLIHEFYLRKPHKLVTRCVWKNVCPNDPVTSILLSSTISDRSKRTIILMVGIGEILVIDLDPIVSTLSLHVSRENVIRAFNCKESTGELGYLAKLGAPITMEHQIDLILQSLNSRYSQFVMNYNMNEIDKNPTELLAMLKTAETNIQKASLAPMLMVNKRKAKGKGKWKYKKKMRSKSNVNLKPVPTKALNPKCGVPKVGDCHYYKKPGHWKRNYHAYLENLKKKKNVAIAASDSDIYVIEVNMSTSISWLLDNGCSSHICINVQDSKEVGH